MGKVILDDNTEIEVTLNVNTFESETEINESVFANNISNVSYEDEDGNVTSLGECNLVFGGLIRDKWLFCLNPITSEERAFKRIAELEEALCELAETFDA